jgi:heptosyltransferase-2
VRELQPAKLLLVGGEADQARLRDLHNPDAVMANNLPLPVVAALLQQAAGFIGHDSGISHIAAATGTTCLLLFGPTDPAVWAPINRDVHVLPAPGGSLEQLSVAAVRQELMRIGIST